jgi:hypothetical protein
MFDKYCIKNWIDEFYDGSEQEKQKILKLFSSHYGALVKQQRIINKERGVRADQDYAESRHSAMDGSW